MKRCFKCGEAKPIDDFYRHPQMGDGHLGKCKECTKRDVKVRYVTEPQKIAAYERVRSRRPERRKKRIEYMRKLRARNPVKYRAWMAVSNAIRDGRLIRGRCKYCGVDDTQAHHTDYSKPLEVTWVCFLCHRQVEHGQECHDGDRVETATLMHCHDEKSTMPTMAAKKQARRGNPPGSEWFSTPNDKRGRPKVQITVDPDTLETMDRLALSEGRSKGAVVDDAIRDYDRKQSKKK